MYDGGRLVIFVVFFFVVVVDIFGSTVVDLVHCGGNDAETLITSTGLLGLLFVLLILILVVVVVVVIFVIIGYRRRGRCHR